MATPKKQFTFSFKEIAAVLVRESKIDDGHWGVFVRFGLAAGNIGDTEETLRPAAIIPIVEIGIQQFPEPNALTVDAAEISREPEANRK